jgi:hypothetical protein
MIIPELQSNTSIRIFYGIPYPKFEKVMEEEGGAHGDYNFDDGGRTDLLEGQIIDLEEHVEMLHRTLNDNNQLIARLTADLEKKEKIIAELQQQRVFNLPSSMVGYPWTTSPPPTSHSSHSPSGTLC